MIRGGIVGKFPSWVKDIVTTKKGPAAPWLLSARPPKQATAEDGKAGHGSVDRGPVSVVIGPSIDT